MSKITFEKDICSDQKDKKTYAWQILLPGVIARLRVQCNEQTENVFDDNLDDNVFHLQQTLEKNEYEMKGGITLVKRQKTRIVRSI